MKHKMPFTNKILKWLKRLNPSKKYSWTDKKLWTSAILEYTADLTIELIDEIYKFPKSLNADGDNARKILSVIENENYPVLPNMSEKKVWGDDSFGETVVSSLVDLYSVVTKKGATRIYVILYPSVLQGATYTFRHPECILSRQVTRNSRDLLSLFVKIFPYD
ncbi:MAG: hypothetical protein J7539_03240 [Niabella sp.]|nr:hypothetical protein [Niabella sp.]